MLSRLASLSVLLAAPALAGPTIEQLAPQNSVVVVGVRNFAETSDKLQNHPLGGMLKARGNGGADDLLDALPPDVRAALGDVGDDARMPEPRGAVGIAIFPGMGDLGVPEPHLMVLADYGNDIEAAAAMLDRMLQDLPQVTVNEPIDEPSVVVRQLAGTTVRTMRMPVEEPDFDDMDNFGGGMGPMDFMPDASDLLGGLDEVHFARSDSSLLMCTHLSSLEKGLQIGRGQPGNSVSKSQDFTGVMNVLGTCDLYTVILNRELLQLTAAVDPMGMAAMFVPTLRTLFGPINGIGYGVSLGAGDTVSESRMVVYTPQGRHGLMALIDDTSPRVQPPAFVSAGAIGYATMNVEFEGVVPLVRRLIMSNPLIQQEIMRSSPNLMEDLAGLEQVFGTLDGRMHVWGDAVAAETGEGAVALGCSDPGAFTAALRGVTGMLGLKEQAVNGGTIFATPEEPNDPVHAPMGGPMGMPFPMARPDMAIGVAKGFVMLGAPAAVRVRMNAAPAAELATNATFRAALAHVPATDIVGWGYTNTSPTGVGLLALVDGPQVWYLQARDNALVTTFVQLMPAQGVAGAE